MSIFISGLADGPLLIIFDRGIQFPVEHAVYDKQSLDTGSTQLLVKRHRNLQTRFNERQTELKLASRPKKSAQKGSGSRGGSPRKKRSEEETEKWSQKVKCFYQMFFSVY